MTFKRMQAVTALGALAVMSIASVSAAGEFEKTPFGLRLGAALSRFSSYADVAAVGGASSGSQWSSSNNPASTDWKVMAGGKTLSLSPQYALLSFAEGTNIHIFSQSATVDLGDWGTIQPAVALANSNESNDRTTGLDFNYDLYYGQIQWGKKINDQWSLGLAFTASSSEIDYDFGPLSIIDSTSDSYSFRAGVLNQPAERWLIGASLEGGWTDTKTDTFLFPGVFTTDDTSFSVVFRTGVSYEYADDPEADHSAIYFDYHLGHFWDSHDELTVHSFHGGVDHMITEGLWARVGGSVDHRGNPSATVGVGVYPTDWLTVDVAYQWGFFPELNPEFGEAQAVVISVSIAF